MKHRYLLTAICLCSMLAMPSIVRAQEEAPRRVERYRSLLSTKNMVVTTTDKKTYFYLVNGISMPMMHLDDASVRICDDVFQKSNIQSIRFKDVPRFTLNEDSTTFLSRTVEHGLLAFRRTLLLDKWNSLVVPFDLTGPQVLDAFGDETLLAKVRGVRVDGDAIIDFDTVDLSSTDVVLSAGVHYLIRPSREPDIAADSRLISAFDDVRTTPGPLYIIPDVSIGSSKRVTTKLYRSDDSPVMVRFRGTYLKLDNSVTTGTAIRNKKAQPGSYAINSEGLFEQHADSVTIPAFCSWVTADDLPETQNLRFFVNGVEEDITALPTAISDLFADRVRLDAEADVFDMTGRRVATGGREALLRSQLPQGIYIINGKKYIKK